uniref:Uncharacterized protein n=1 Tax=Strongyloides papillosus TaxID=174720 RepID=A0A0N5CIP7_STREA
MFLKKVWQVIASRRPKEEFDESGIRTHASEDTSALNWRLRPLGHLATSWGRSNSSIEGVRKLLT